MHVEAQKHSDRYVHHCDIRSHCLEYFCCSGKFFCNPLQSRLVTFRCDRLPDRSILQENLFWLTVLRVHTVHCGREGMAARAAWSGVQGPCHSTQEAESS